jgi:hypothetical protein
MPRKLRRAHKSRLGLCGSLKAGDALVDLAAKSRAECLHPGRTPPVSTGRMLGGSAHRPSRGAPSLASRSLAEVIARQVGAYAMCDPGGCNWNASKASAQRACNSAPSPDLQFLHEHVLFDAATNGTRALWPADVLIAVEEFIHRSFDRDGYATGRAGGSARFLRLGQEGDLGCVPINHAALDVCCASDSDGEADIT